MCVYMSGEGRGEVCLCVLRCKCAESLELITIDMNAFSKFLLGKKSAISMFQFVF